MGYSKSTIKKNYINHDLFIVNVFLIGLIVLLTLIIYHYIPSQLTDFEVLLPQFLSGVQPKPIEKAIFLFCAITIPLFSLGYTFLNQTKRNYYFSNVFNALAPVLLGITFFSFLFRSDWIHFLFKGFLGSGHHLSYWILGFFFISLNFSIILCRENFKKYCLINNQYYKALNWFFFLFATVYIVAAWRLTSIYAADHSFRSVHHLDAILYPLSQVVHGKTILVDLPSQYGLFPELLAPIFKIIGLTVFKFSLVMAILEIIAVIALFFILTKLIKSPILVFLGGLTLIILTSENELYLAGFPDPYYQYWPIRFFFPAVSVSLFYWFCITKTHIRSLSFSVISSLAIIWNLDTGIFVFISYGVYLVVSYLFCLKNKTLDQKISRKWNKKDYITAFIVHFVVLVGILFLFDFLLKITSGHSLNYSWIYSYQVVFYKLGYGMMPIPKKTHPWMLVIILYIYGLNFSLNSFKYHSTYRAELIFYLSILGLGLFTYYEGRSHVANLFKVMWPALIISLFFAEQTIRSIRLKLISPINIIFPAEIITVFLICFALFAANSLNIYTDLRNQFRNQHRFVSPLVSSELQFIKDNTYRGQDCLLLIKNQATYYAESDLVSPIKGPGLVETMLKADLAYLKNQVNEQIPKCVMLGRNESEFNLGLNYDELFKKYIVTKTNKENTIQLLQPESLFIKH